jgi:hypothetical protein
MENEKRLGWAEGMNRKHVGCGRKEVGAAVMLQLIDIQDVGGSVGRSRSSILGGGWLCDVGEHCVLCTYIHII